MRTPSLTDPSSTSTEPSLVRRLRCTPATLSVLVAAFIIFANNGKLFRSLNEQLDLLSLHGAIYLCTVYIALIGVFAVLFMSLGNKLMLKPLLIGGLILSAVLGYFTNDLGVVFDTEMMNNIHETARDNNTAEAFELASLPLALHVALFGLLPALLVALTKIERKSFVRELSRRAAYSVGILVAIGLMILVDLKDISYITREHRNLKVYATPAYAIDSLRKHVVETWFTHPPEFKQRGVDAAQFKASPKRTVGFMVVGETARADHWSLNGYPRDTNPMLAQRDLLNFTHMTASGTSTAYSVPCMFSLLSKSAYTKSAAANESNVLDVIQRAGLQVLWIDNNSSSKGVADRVLEDNLTKQVIADSAFYTGDGYFDEELLVNLDQYLAETGPDMLIVLHMMGSHGPAYHRRYPSEFEVFSPACESDAPQDCSDEYLVNAYDNTILYTDFVLDKLIAKLEERRDSVESFVFYSSDHGESLGENGIYLHGLPDFLAPDAQTHVPAFLWLSKPYVSNHSIELDLLKSRTEEPYSHDFISHSLLSLLDVRTGDYNDELDLLRDAKHRLPLMTAHKDSGRPASVDGL